jgi:cytochrome P450
MFWQIVWYLSLAICAYVTYIFLQMMIRIWSL